MKCLASSHAMQLRACSLAVQLDPAASAVGHCLVRREHATVPPGPHAGPLLLLLLLKGTQVVVMATLAAARVLAVVLI